MKHKLNLKTKRFDLSLEPIENINPDTDDVSEKNWKLLTEHIKDRFRSREKDFQYIQTKAIFVMTANAFIIPAALDNTNPATSGLWSLIVYWSIASLLSLSFILAGVSIFIGKATTAPEPSVFVDKLNKGKVTHQYLNEWLVDSYSKAIIKFNKSYDSKDNLLRVAVALISTAIVLLFIHKMIL